MHTLLKRLSQFEAHNWWTQEVTRLGFSPNSQAGYFPHSNTSPKEETASMYVCSINFVGLFFQVHRQHTWSSNWGLRTRWGHSCPNVKLYVEVPTTVPRQNYSSSCTIVLLLVLALLAEKTRDERTCIQKVVGDSETKSKSSGFNLDGELAMERTRTRSGRFYLLGFAGFGRQHPLLLFL